MSSSITHLYAAAALVPRCNQRGPAGEQNTARFRCDQSTAACIMPSKFKASGCWSARLGSSSKCW